MTELKSNKPVCFLALPRVSGIKEVRQSIETGAEKAGYEIRTHQGLEGFGQSTQELLTGVLAGADCVIADLTEDNPQVYFEWGLACAMGKEVVTLRRQDNFLNLPLDVYNLKSFTYVNTSQGFKNLTDLISKVLEEFRQGAKRSQVFAHGQTFTPFFIDWDLLDYSDAENLCRELLSQMGFKKIDWNVEPRIIDLIAEYPRKDPDGYEYRELWLIKMGQKGHFEELYDLMYEPELLIHRLMQDNKLHQLQKTEDEILPFTLLIVDFSAPPGTKKLEILRRRIGRRKVETLSMRIRIWDREYLTALLRQFPNLGYKYFSEQSRSLAKFRKGPEELYQENLLLTERLTQTIKDLEEEKNRRIRAERDSVWKDISFAAAHKIGNPIFAIETDLGPLEKRIKTDQKDEAMKVVENIRSAIEKAKNIVEQFKSLTKSQQLNPVKTLLLPIIIDSCKIFDSQNVKCRIECPPDLTVFGDPEKLSEIFDELVRNSLHWLNKPKKIVTVKVTSAGRLPSEVDSNRKYALVHFRDNGSGVEFENKSRIFDAFFSTSDQGTGLGLALVRRIVEGHGGTILESGVPGKGADFEIYLPLAEETKK